MAGATIRLYLIDGTPLGPRTLEKSNWSGRALDFARLDWTRVRDRAELLRPGIYVLRGRDSDGTAVVYVGQTDKLRGRIEQHHSGPNALDFWTRCVAFSSRDDSFNNAYWRRIESKLIGQGHQARRVTLKNGNAPGLPALSEADEAEADAFLDEMLVLLPLLDIDAFTLPTEDKTGPRLQLKGRGIEAFGRESQEGFVVLAGSHATVDTVASLHEYVRKRRQSLVEQGILVPDVGLLRLTQDYTFDSPSTAASVMLGRSSNGREAWKDAGGRALKELQNPQTPTGQVG